MKLFFPKKNNKINSKTVSELRNKIFTRTLKFTETVVVWVFIIYILNWIVSMLMIWYAIKTTCNFSYLDTLIAETSSSFRDIVGIAVIKFGVENIFKYNDFGGKIPSKDDTEYESNDITSEMMEDNPEINETEIGGKG